MLEYSTGMPTIVDVHGADGGVWVEHALHGGGASICVCSKAPAPPPATKNSSRQGGGL